MLLNKKIDHGKIVVSGIKILPVATCQDIFNFLDPGMPSLALHDLFSHLICPSSLTK